MVEYYVDDSVLRHYGVQGMKWGVRKDVGATRSEWRTARKDAKEFTQAKMFYGEGAGTRRKLIKAKVNQRAAAPGYKKAFDYHVENTNMAKRSDQARGQRKRATATATTVKTGRGLINYANGNPQMASALAVSIATIGGVAYKAGAHKVVAKYAKTAYGVASRELRAMQIKKQFKNWNIG